MYIFNQLGAKFMKNSRRPKLLLLAGVNGVGKSTLSMEIANFLGIKRVVSTDSVREVLRSKIDSLESPELHRSTFSVGRHKHPIYDWEECSNILSESINSVIDKSRREGVDLILERLEDLVLFLLILLIGMKLINQVLLEMFISV